MTAPDLEAMAREAGRAGLSYTDWSMSDALFDAVTALDETGARIDTAAYERAWKEGRDEHCAATWLARWTTAPVDYDQFGTETAEGCGLYRGKTLRKVFIDPVQAPYQVARYASGNCGTWDEDPRELDRNMAERNTREQAEREAHEARRKAGLEWLWTASSAILDGDSDTLDEELRARGLRWEDGRDERKRRVERREAEERAATWVRCRAAVPDGSTVVDPGEKGYRGTYGWIPGRDPRAWRLVIVQASYRFADDANEAMVIGEGNVSAGCLLDVADAIAAGTMRLAAPDEHVPPWAVVNRIGRPYTEILRVELGGKAAWVGEPAFLAPLVLDDAGRVVRTKALREAGNKAWQAKRSREGA